VGSAVHALAQPRANAAGGAQVREGLEYLLFQAPLFMAFQIGRDEVPPPEQEAPCAMHFRRNGPTHLAPPFMVEYTQDQPPGWSETQAADRHPLALLKVMAAARPVQRKCARPLERSWDRGRIGTRSRSCARQDRNAWGFVGSVGDSGSGGWCHQPRY